MTSGVDFSDNGLERRSETSGEPIPLVTLYPLFSQVNNLEPVNVVEHRFEVPLNMEDQEPDEIFRGERPPSPIDDGPASEEEEGGSSTTSSSSSFNVGRRLGALAAVVEAAIHRWYGGHDQRSLSSTSSSSSSFSFPGTIGTRTTRRRRNHRYSSNVSLSTAQQERAYIARRKAREEFRLIPREFVLLLPPTASGGSQHPRGKDAIVQRVVKTSSIPTVLDHLQLLLKKSAKLQKSYARSAIAREATVEVARNNDLKGKSKQAAASAIGQQPLKQKEYKERKQPVPYEQGWWLDVASPKWEDMRKLGNILRLHPLTLEDIIHQDPREKLEFFPRLGYYFIVFRALEGARSRERFRRFMTNSSEGVSIVPTGPADEGVLGAVNVYLVIFREGICTFHFEDISEHTEKLRERILRLENSIKVSTDWIAHGLLDSIVDSFFPVLGSIEKEIKDIDNLVMLHPSHAEIPEIDPTLQQGVDPDASHAPVKEEFLVSSGSSDTARVKDTEKSPKIDSPDVKSHRPRFVFPLATARPLTSFRRIKYEILKYISQSREKESNAKESDDQSSSSTLRTLLRIAATRRIVTSLGRLLGTKGEVLMQIRKRLLIRARDAGVNVAIRDAGDMVIYMGDILDHIVTLQHSLAHYERVLSTSHPAYLSQLRVTQFQARGSRDKSILWLSTITMLVPCVQIVSGVFSMNIVVPTNDHTGDKYTYFVIIVVFSILVALGIVALTQYWKYSAKKKFRRKI